MTNAKPFLTQFASDLRNDTPDTQPDTRGRNDITPPPPSTFLTKVRNETTDDS